MRLFFFVYLIALPCFAQGSNSEQDQLSQRERMIQEFMKSRKKMMDKMLDAFGEDGFDSNDMDDKFFDSIIGDRFKNIQNQMKHEKLVSVYEFENSDGSVDVFIKPKDKSVTLDIETKNNAIVIKAKQIEKVENDNKGNVSSSMSQSSFTQTIRIPNGFEASTPKSVKERVKITLKPKALKLKNDKDKKPILKQPGEEVI